MVKAEASGVIQPAGNRIEARKAASACRVASVASGGRDSLFHRAARDLAKFRGAIYNRNTSSLGSRAGVVMGQTANVNPISEHELFLRLFITNGGGW